MLPRAVEAISVQVVDSQKSTGIALLFSLRDADNVLSMAANFLQSQQYQFLSQLTHNFVALELSLAASCCKEQAIGSLSSHC